MQRIISRIPLELMAWAGGLAWLGLTDPHGDLPQFCVYKLAGFSSCPGCGLGSAVSHLLHGDIAASWASHPLGVPVLAVLLVRMAQLLKQEIHSFKSFKPEKKPI